MKKNFEAPYLKVVNVKNDIIATSATGTIGNDVTSESGILAPRRRGVFDDDYSEDYDY